MIISTVVFAHCPFDHFLIGCNQDGVIGTNDDMKLFVDCTNKYRHSDPARSGDPTWLNWYYPMYYNQRYKRYQIDEPGFELMEDDDPNRMLVGTLNEDYRIIIRCVSITPGFVVWNNPLGLIFDEPGDSFDFVDLQESHFHLEYRAGVPAGSKDLHWVTFQIVDEMVDTNQYEASETFTIVFVREPLAGDLVVDGIVDINDLVQFGYYWLNDEGDRTNDYYERADANRDGLVDFLDFTLLASNWLKSLND